MSDFTGKTVLITGAAGGIGTAMAERFAAAGARLALVDIIAADDLAARLGTDHRAWQLDLEDAAAIADTVARIGAEMGVDVLINNAGLGVVFPADQADVALWDRTMRINLRAPWLMAVAALPACCLRVPRRSSICEAARTPLL